MKGYHLKFIRHGETEANENGVYIGRTDIPLSKAGKDSLFEQMEKYDYTSVQKVYTSPLLRCVQTANILFPNTFTTNINELREMDFGDFEGKSADELVNRDDFKQWLKGGLDNPPPNGESLRLMVERCYDGMASIIGDMMSEGLTNCAVITHGGIIMNALSCFGVPKYKPMELPCDFGHGYEVLITAAMWQRSNAFEIMGKYPYLPENTL